MIKKNLLISLALFYIACSTQKNINLGRDVSNKRIDDVSCQKIVQLLHSNNHRRLSTILKKLEKKYKKDDLTKVFRNKFLDIVNNQKIIFGKKVDLKDHFMSGIYVFKSNRFLLIEIPHLQKKDVLLGDNSKRADMLVARFLTGMFSAIDSVASSHEFQGVKIIASNVANYDLAKNLDQLGFISSSKNRKVTKEEIENHYKKNIKMFNLWKSEQNDIIDVDTDVEDTMYKEYLEEIGDIKDMPFKQQEKAVMDRFFGKSYEDNFNKDNMYYSENSEGLINTINFELLIDTRK